MRGRRHGAGGDHRTNLTVSAIPESNPRPRAIALKISVIARQMRKLFDASVGEIGITRSQWTTIAVVSGKPGATQREIADILEMSEASAGRVIDRLCADGKLERRPKPDDRRAHTIWLTDAAQPLLGDLSRAATGHETRVFSGLSDSELDTLEQLLCKIYANVTDRRTETP